MTKEVRYLKSYYWKDYIVITLGLVLFAIGFTGFIMPNEIASHINTELNRGCTVLEGTGWYSQQPQKVLIILARKAESSSIFRLVKRIDENAFISQSNVVGVYGKGFDQMK
jgi:uncharacterized membrane-anchored protein YitT (DUF2179 family)